MDKLLLLHGALGTKEQLQPLQGALSECFDTDTFNFSGHGGLDLPEQYDFELFAQDIINWQDENGITKSDIFGYSMGGYAALYLALKHPERVGRIFTLGTKLIWAETSSQQEVKMLNPDIIEQKVPAFAEKLKAAHAPQDWKQVMQLTAQMMLSLGEEPPLKEKDFNTIEHQVLLAVGDQDITAGVEDTVKVNSLMPNAQLMIVPNTPHPLEKVDLERIVPEIERFFSE